MTTEREKTTEASLRLDWLTYGVAFADSDGNRIHAPLVLSQDVLLRNERCYPHVIKGDDPRRCARCGEALPIF